jgi:hypothetical protein
LIKVVAIDAVIGTAGAQKHTGLLSMIKLKVGIYRCALDFFLAAGLGFMV